MYIDWSIRKWHFENRQVLEKFWNSFSRKFLMTVNLWNHHTVMRSHESTTQLQSLRKNKHFPFKLTIFTKEELISRKFFSVTQCGKVAKNKIAISVFTEKWPFFRQINVFTKEITKEFISRKFLSVITFHTTFHCAWSRAFYSTIELISRNFLPKEKLQARTIFYIFYDRYHHQ